jgi:hypothetical protein
VAVMLIIISISLGFGVIWTKWLNKEE